MRHTGEASGAKGQLVEGAHKGKGRYLNRSEGRGTPPSDLREGNRCYVSRVAADFLAMLWYPSFGNVPAVSVKRLTFKSADS